MSQRPTAERVIVTSFIVDLSDILLNVIVAILSGSVVMLSQALQGTADLITSALLLIGTHQAHRRATTDYRFGHGRELFFWVLVAGVTMFALTGVLSVVFGLQRLKTPVPIEQLALSQTILAIGLITNSYALWLSYRRLINPTAKPIHFWRRWHRSMLVETKTTLILDLMGTLASFAGLIALGLYGQTGSLAFDAVGSIIIGVMTMLFSIGLIINAKSLLVGRSASAEIIAQIRQVILTIPEVKAVLSIHTLYIGTEQLLANIDVNMVDNLTTNQLEQLIQTIKQTVKTQVPIVRHTQIELVP